MKLRIHRILYGSVANGPGIRNVLWVQGCSLHCPGCFNPAGQDPKGGTWADAADLVTRLCKDHPDSVTISGGEPFQQAEALLSLLRPLRERCDSILIFSGMEWEALRNNPVTSQCLRYADALICGPYRADRPPAYNRFCSSDNQQLILLSKRHSVHDFANLPLGEVLIDPDGKVTRSGIQIF